MFFRCVLFSILIACSACSNQAILTSAINTFAIDDAFQGYFNDDIFAANNPIAVAVPSVMFNLPDSIKQQLDKQVAHLPTRLERLVALRHWVYNEIADYEYDVGTTVPISELEKVNRINCYSFSMLFKVAADYVDVPAEIHFIDTSPRWDMQKKTWVYLQHISVVSEIHGFYSSEQLETIAGIPALLNIDYKAATSRKLVFLTDINPALSDTAAKTRALTKEQVAARFYINKAAEALLADDLSTAYTYSKYAIAVDQHSAEAWNNLGVIYTKKNALSAARMAYQRSFDLDDTLLTNLNNLYATYIRMGEGDAAMGFIAEHKSIWKKNPYFYYNLGETSAAIGDYQQAIQHYLAAISLKSDEPLFYQALSTASLQLRSDKASRSEDIANGGSMPEEAIASSSAMLSKI